MFSPNPLNYNALAKLAGQNRAGLNSEDFMIYLEWLLGKRGGSGEGRGDFNAAIYATSTTHAVNGVPFKSMASLRRWSEGIRPSKQDDDWDSFSF